jgi:hypothetical protein
MAEETTAAIEFFSAADRQALLLVIAGGVIGGLLQPVYARLNPRTDAPPPIHFLWSPLLGVAAAGITVFVIAHTDTDKALPILFFSLLCGLAFPAILASAVDNVGKNTANVQAKVANIADKAQSNDPSEVANAVGQLKTVMGNNPAKTITDQGQKLVEASAAEAVRNIAETAMAKPEQTREIVEQLRDVGTVAQSAGYLDTAIKAADELEKLASDTSLTDRAAKKIAEDAATRLKAE